MPFLPEFSPKLIDFLIEMEKKEQEEQENRPFLQIPAPKMPILPLKNDEKEPKNDENGAIIMDI